MISNFLPLNDSFIQYTQNPFQIVLSVKEFSRMISLDSEYLFNVLNERYNRIVNIDSLANIYNLETSLIFPMLTDTSFNEPSYRFYTKNNKIYIRGNSSKSYYVTDEYIPLKTFLKVTEDMFLDLRLRFLQSFDMFQDIHQLDILNGYRDINDFLDKLSLYKYLFKTVYFGLEQFHTQFMNDSDDNLIIPIDLDRKTKQLLIKLSMKIKNNNDGKINFIDYIDKAFEQTYQPYILMNDIIGNDDFLSL